MRLLHVYSGNLFGGIESMLLTCARAAATCPSLEHEFALCFDDQLSADLCRLGSRVHTLGAVRVRRPGTVIAARQRLETVVFEGRFDGVVCHAPWTQAIFGSVVRRSGVPLVYWAHDVMTGRHWTERLAAFVEPDLAICNSAFTAGTLPALFPRTRSVVIHPPVWTATADSCRVTDDRQSRCSEIRASLETSAEACVVVQVSRLEAWKGHTLLLEALSALVDEPNWIWWIVGGAQRPAEQAYLASLRAAALESGVADRIRWVGPRADVPDLLAAADIHCQPNLSPEPFGIAFVEALAAGLPVVTVDLGGAREIVTERCGVLTPPGDARTLAQTLRRLIGDRGLRARLSSGARARAQHLSDPATQLQRLHEALGPPPLLEATA